MRKFKYIAVDLHKQRFTGIFIAEDEKDLAAQLAKQNLFLLSCSPYSGTTSSFFTLGFGTVPLPELTAFCRQFSIMINSGISIFDALDVLKTQSYSSFFRSLLEIITEDVRGGLLLSEALKKHKKAFPDLFRSMIYIGEISGKLDIVLSSLADYYESDAAIRRKAKSALAYPIILGILTFAILILMMVFIVPRFRSTMSVLEVEAEGITKIVYDASDFFLTNWQTILLAIIAVGGIFFLVSRTKSGRLFLDQLALKLPLIGKIQVDMIAARFARAFGLLLMSGVDVVDAMENVSIILGNRFVEQKFHEATNFVREGMSLTIALNSCKIFPPMLIQMLSIGEKTNALDSVLTRSCGFFDTQVETSLNALTSRIQFAMLLFMGVVVALLFIAIYSPMISIMSSLGV